MSWTDVFVAVGFVAGIVNLGEFVAVRIVGPLRNAYRNRKRRAHPTVRLWIVRGAALVTLVATIVALFVSTQSVKVGIASILILAFAAGNYADYRDGHPRSKGLSILRARYGASGGWIDVKALIVAAIKSGRVSMSIDNVTMGGDPIYGSVKSLEITYAAGTNAPISIVVPEGGQLSIP